jgi:hypothetical protein
MAVIDYERAWIRLKAVIVEKGSHGQRDLLAEMGRIEVECAAADDSFDPGPPVRRIGRKDRGAA